MEKDLIHIKEEELAVLLSDIKNKYGYDFRDYSEASLTRRINRLFIIERIPSFAELRYKILNNTDFFGYFLEAVTVNVTEMFRDPSFYIALREKVFPQLATYPFIRIWHAGCSTGEEVYSMAILLKESGLLNKSILYATDINQEVLEKAKKGIFPLSTMKTYSENYIKASGSQQFSDYYTANYGFAQFDPELTKRMVFSSHNLASDQSFNEFNLIVCRNVFIYFKRNLQNTVLGLFRKSLVPLGYLALGSKESIQFSEHDKFFVEIDKKNKIWRTKNDSSKSLE
jgi:chemotaxis protein methyltransferase CheR